MQILATLEASPSRAGHVDPLEGKFTWIQGKQASCVSCSSSLCISAGDDYLQETHRLLLRASLMRHDLLQRAQTKGGRIQHQEQTMRMG